MNHLLQEQQRINKRGAADAFNGESQASSGSSASSSLYGDPLANPPGQMNAAMAEMLGFDITAMQSVANHGPHIWIGDVGDTSPRLAGFGPEIFARTSLGS